MKKVVSLVISLLLIIGIVPISASAETTSITQDGIEYIIDTATGEAEVFYADSGIVTAEITSEINGYPVTSIGDGAFYNCTSLTSVTIPDSVISIGYLAFAGCTSLTSVTIPDSVTSIGFSAFEDCTSLTSVTIPDSVTSIGDSAFSGCTSLTSVTIGGSVTSIDYSAFSGCTSLTSVTIGGSVTSIGGYAFEDCTSLTEITIPDSVTSIGYWAFDGCTSLTEINVDENNQNYHSENGVLFNKDKTELIQYPAGKSDTSYTIPDSVISIGVEAFSWCTSLTAVTIPDSVTSIGGSAFWCCTSLTPVTIPDSVTSISWGAFYNTAYYNDETNWENGVLYIGNCLIDAQKTHYDENYNDVVDLEVKGEYTIKDGAKLIADNAFSRCASLTSVTIPDSVTSIGWYAFEDCTSLTSIIIPDSVTSIGAGAFGYYYDGSGYFRKIENFTIYGYAGSAAETYANENGFTFIDVENMPEPPTDIETTSITQDGITYEIDTATGEAEVDYADESIVTADIPSEINGYPVTSIGYEAFSGCTSLTSVTIPDSVTSIGYWAFYNTAYYNDETNWENGVLYLESYLIEAKTDISGKYTIKDGTKLIADYAFYKCTSLTAVTIPDSVTSIGYGAFAGCTSLTSVTIPDSVTSIGEGAFEDCTSLTTVTIGGSVTSIGDYAFGYYYDYGYKKLENFTIYGYTGSAAETYANVNGFTFIDIGDVPETPTDIETTSITQDGITYEIDTTTGEAEVDDADESIVTAEITSEINGYPVTSIGYEAFSGCTSLTSVTIPDSVTSIDHWAFHYCTSLTEITIPDSVTSIGHQAFIECTSLTEITIGNGVTSIGSNAFCNCTSLTSVTIPDSVTSIGADAFYWCESLSSVTIGGSVTSIGSNAFCNCTSLTEVTIPDSVTSIGDWAFSWCESLTSVTIPDSVTSIGRYAFSGCTSLTSVTIPDSVTSIGEGAFAGCTSLTSVTIPDSVTSIGEGAFGDCTSLTEITIPDSVTSIGDWAFRDCKSLTSVTIPDSVTSIGDYAFGYSYDYGYKKLENFTIYGYTGSAAETYANDKSFTFIDVENMPEKPTTQGDLNGDGKVSVADARLILVAIAGGNADNQYIAIADLNGDGKLSIADARSLLVKIANGEV